MTGIRYGNGGFEDRFRVTRTDGRAVRQEARYLVLDYANDPHAKIALDAYAASVRSENEKLAEDLLDAIANPLAWPSQHD